MLSIATPAASGICAYIASLRAQLAAGLPSSCLPPGLASVPSPFGPRATSMNAVDRIPERAIVPAMVAAPAWSAVSMADGYWRIQKTGVGVMLGGLAVFLLAWWVARRPRTPE